MSPIRLTPGDPAPWVTARSIGNPAYKLHMAAGRWMVVTILPSAGSAPGNALARALGEDQGSFDDRHACLFLASRDPADEAQGRLEQRLPGIRVFWDGDGEVAKSFGCEAVDQPVSFVLTPRMQVMTVVATADPAQQARAVVGAVRAAPRLDALPEAMTVTPVLVIPGVLEPELCRELIRRYQASGGRESGFMRDVDGKTTEIRDPGHKVRKDHDIEDPAMVQMLQARFVRRVVPEIKKAFQFEVTRMERYIVACYAAEDGGHFRAHRDNTTLGTAHRRFAVSVNLNAEEYEGGDLRFPEFGMRTYRAPTGGGVVFSCSLLHEATRVTRGTRYAFLPFLYDEAARKIREANLRHLAARAEQARTTEKAGA
jgi:predicted 2-oxoglutarate/Fe(II)-dependent dioxygenase YbiX/peroxiredoxin